MSVDERTVELQELGLRIAYLQDQIVAAADRRSRLVRQLQKDGMTYRAIAEAIGLTPHAIEKIAHRTAPMTSLSSRRGIRSR